MITDPELLGKRDSGCLGRPKYTKVDSRSESMGWVESQSMGTRGSCSENGDVSRAAKEDSP